MESQIEPETTAEYKEGRAAQVEGLPNSANPYASGRGTNNRRTWWFMGWYDEKNSHLLEG